MGKQSIEMNDFSTPGTKNTQHRSLRTRKVAPHAAQRNEIFAKINPVFHLTNAAWMDLNKTGRGMDIRCAAAIPREVQKKAFMCSLCFRGRQSRYELARFNTIFDKNKP